MFPRVPFRPRLWKRRDPPLPKNEKGERLAYEGEGTENNLLLQIEVVKGLTPERRQRIRDMASILAGSILRPFDEEIYAHLGRQFGLQSLQIKIILDTVEDDIVDDVHLRKIVGLDPSGRKINPEEIE